MRKWRLIITGALFLLFGANGVYWLVQGNRFDVTFLENGVPLSGYTVDEIESGGPGMEAKGRRLDENGRLDFGWEFAREPTDCIVGLSKGDQWRSWAVTLFDCNSLVIDKRGATTIITRKKRHAFFTTTRTSSVTDLAVPPTPPRNAAAPPPD